jgi:ssDNA-binding Zn-finger/Zn-ribbon topoisomerase 1
VNKWSKLESELNQTRTRTRNDDVSFRPICPVCGRELVLSLIYFGDNKFHAYLCDCASQPEGVASEIVRAREFPGEVLSYIAQHENEDDDE